MTHNPPPGRGVCIPPDPEISTTTSHQTTIMCGTMNDYWYRCCIIIITSQCIPSGEHYITYLSSQLLLVHLGLSLKTKPEASLVYTNSLKVLHNRTRVKLTSYRDTHPNFQKIISRQNSKNHMQWHRNRGGHGPPKFFGTLQYLCMNEETSITIYA